jgi:ubiquinone/menaquinone biosynthesis C-methylase UbiE
LILKIKKLWQLFLSSSSNSNDYSERLRKEVETFNKVENVHALPDIFHYWSHQYLRPKFIEMGIRGIYEFFFDYMSAACEQTSAINKFVSIGSGHCEIEIQIVEMLLQAGYKNFVLECLDINPGMLKAAERSSEDKGVSQYLRFVNADALTWKPEKNSYSVVMAHQSLHHIVDLELLFGKIKKAIGKDGVFLTSDIIGRNGHMRWPEAMKEIDKIWVDMPNRYKYNHALKRVEKSYENWDCSTEGFEGIRAQDILALLNKEFSYEMFLGFGNLIDIFVDRAFGHNFDPESEEDKKFIDKVAELDDQLIESGALKPTHIIAVLRSSTVLTPKYYKHLTPEFCTRNIDSSLAG